MSHEEVEICCITSECCGDEKVIIKRRFLSKDEKLDDLKRYKEQLEKELAGVMERINELS